MRTYIEIKGNENATYQNLRNVKKAVLSGRLWT
jgi:hypothetical protein